MVDYLGPPFDFSNALCEIAKILFASYELKENLRIIGIDLYSVW